MVNRTDLENLWGAEDVCRASSTELAPILSSEQQEFLISTGVPRYEKWLFMATPAKWHVVLSNEWVQIGTDEASSIRVSANGPVKSFALESEKQSRFVNSTLPLFVEFLYLVTVARRAFPSLSDAESDAELEKLQLKCSDADPRAFQDTESFWSVIFEQMRDNLF